MPKVGPDETQISYVIPKVLDARITKHQHRQELSSKKAALLDLIERGLQAAEQEQREAPKP